MSHNNVTSPALFVGYKPSGMSSNQFLGRLKRKYGVKKAGYSGTLDPFAKGVLIVALGNYTRLFRFLDKTPKTYRATLWLGAASETLDIEGVQKVYDSPQLKQSDIEDVLQSFIGELEYIPPKFSAKKVAGRRAYDLARKGEEVILKPITSTIYDSKLLHYTHPFITFEITVSEGSYIRSIAQLIAQKLLVPQSSLSALERINEGCFCYNFEKPLDIRKVLAIKENFFRGDVNQIMLGQKLDIDDFTCKDDGEYWIDLGDCISIINIENMCVKYTLNKVGLC